MADLQEIPVGSRQESKETQPKLFSERYPHVANDDCKSPDRYIRVGADCDTQGEAFLRNGTSKVERIFIFSTGGSAVVRVCNSRGRSTVGYMQVPIESMLELCAKLLFNHPLAEKFFDPNKLVEQCRQEINDYHQWVIDCQDVPYDSERAEKDGIRRGRVDMMLDLLKSIGYSHGEIVKETAWEVGKKS